MTQIVKTNDTFYGRVSAKVRENVMFFTHQSEMHDEHRESDSYRVIIAGYPVFSERIGCSKVREYYRKTS